METSYLLYALSLLAPIIFIMFWSAESIFYSSLVAWAGILLAMLIDATGFGWVIIIFWLAFGIPVAMLYCSFLVTIKSMMSRSK